MTASEPWTRRTTLGRMTMADFLIVLFKVIMLTASVLGAVLVLFIMIAVLIGCIDAMRRRR